MHRDELRTPRIGWALIFLLGALPLLPGPIWSQTQPSAVYIGTADSVIPGSAVELPVEYWYFGDSFSFAGFDLLLAFDATHSQLVSIAPGDLLIDCEWEYFTYRSSIDSTGPPGELNGRLRLVALAETSNGDIHPSCLLDSSGGLAVLTFAVSADASLEETYLPIRFYWADCGDNVFSTTAGDTLVGSGQVIEHGQYITADAPFPNYTGTPSSCLTAPAGSVVRWLDFYHGGVYLIADDSAHPNPPPDVSLRIAPPPYLQPGDTGVVRIVIDSIAPGFETGGFNLFLQYDSSAMTVLSVEQGQILTDCGWELFAWRHGGTNDCNGGPCEKPTIHITALADYLTPGFPLCWAISEGEVARLTVVANSDPASILSAYPIEWAWYGCTDNEWASKNGDSVYISRRVFDHSGVEITAESAFPTVTGSPSSCLPSPTIIRSIDYGHGLIDIVSADSLDSRGDVNYNGTAYEIADWVLFANCFFYGSGILTTNPAAQTAATDVNADSIPLTLDDLIFLMRIVIGDALPYPRLPATNDTLVIEQDVAARTVSFAWPGSVRGLYLKFDDSVDVAFDARLGSSEAGAGVFRDSTIVLITPSFQFTDSLASFPAGAVLSHTGDANLVYAEASYDGQVTIPVVIRSAAGPVRVQIAPEIYSVAQIDSVVPIPAVLYVGNMVGCTPDEIDPATVRINGTIAGQSWSIVQPPQGFSGDVLAVNFDAWGLIAPLFPSWGTDTVGCSVSWLAAQGCPQGGTGAISLIGYQLGDVNADGAINVSDLTLLVAYFFRDGASHVSAEAADINNTGSATVRDLVTLVEILFH